MKQSSKLFIALLALLGLVCISYNGNAQNFSDRWLQSANKRDMTIATVGGDVIESLKKKERDPNVLAFLNEITSLCVITIDKDGATAASCYEKALKSLQDSFDYKELVSMHRGRQTIVIASLGQTAPNKAREIVMLSYDDNRSLTIVNLVGDISTDKLGNLAASVKKSIQKF